MANEWIPVGSAFTVTCNTVDPVTGAPLITLTDFSGHRVYYRRPDGVRGYLTPDQVTATTLIATVPLALNPVSIAYGDPKWAYGYAGNWEFYPYCVGAGSNTFRGKRAILIVHPEWSTPP